MANELNFAYLPGLTVSAQVFAPGWVQQGADIPLTETGVNTALYVGSVPAVPAIADGEYTVLFLDVTAGGTLVGRGPLYWAGAAEDRQAVQSVTAYADGIWIDTLGGGAPGAVPGVNGIQSNPIDNITDALALSAALGVESFKLLGPVTLNASIPFSRWEAQGGDSVVNVNGFDVGGSIFTRIGISGVMNNTSGPIFGFEAFLVGPITGLQGTFREPTIRGTLTTAAGPLTLVDGSSNIPGTATPIINLNGVSDLNLRNYSGGLELQGSTSGLQNSSIEIAQGQLILAPSCTDGVIAVRGFPALIDNSTGSTINLDAYGPNLVQDQILSDDTPFPGADIPAALVAISFMSEFILGGRNIDFVGNDALGWQRVERDSVGVEVARYNLFDESGARINEPVSGFIARAGMISSEVLI